MGEKRFFCIINKKGRNVIIDKECNIEIIDLTMVCDVLNRLDLKLKHYNEVNGEQQATICKLQDLCGQSDGENARLRIENKKLKEEKGYWKGKAMTLLMQVRRLTPRMTDKEVIEFSKELENE